VTRKSNSATEARKEMMMERFVAKPVRILSEYFVTTAVISPAEELNTVAQAHAPKLRNTSMMIPFDMVGMWLTIRGGGRV
jgi:hypothetical protein